MLINELCSKKSLIISAAQKHGASDIKVFGSVARGEERDDSDVDVLVSLPKGYDMFKQRLSLKEELENIIGRNVDLIVRHEINKHLKATILSNARNL